MALCAAALRRYLLGHDALPVGATRRDRAGVSANGDKADQLARGWPVRCALHTGVEDPVERLAAIHQSMAPAKELQRAVPAAVVTDMTQFTPPVLAAQASRSRARSGSPIA